MDVRMKDNGRGENDRKNGERKWGKGRRIRGTRKEVKEYVNKAELKEKKCISC